MCDGSSSTPMASGDHLGGARKTAPGVRARAPRAARSRARRRRLPGAMAAAILLLSACAHPTRREAPARALKPGPSLGVLREGWHTGLVVPDREFSGALRPLREALTRGRFALIGWGDRRYYMARRPGPLTGLEALFPSRSVVHVRVWRARLPLRQRATWLHLGPRGWRGLRTFLGHSLARAPDGALEILGAHGHRGLFFASTATYDAFHTCNTWTMQALHAAHLPAASGGILFAGQVSAALHAPPLRRFWARGPRSAPPAPVHNREGVAGQQLRPRSASASRRPP